MQPKTPQTFTGSMKDAYARALELSEPIFVPAPVYTDDRGWSIMNQFLGVMTPEGQVNYSVQYPGIIKAWHRHKHQTDFWMCLNGHLKAGVHRESDGAAWAIVIGEKRPGTLVIPPTLWHGAATVGHEPAGLLYYVTKAFDPAHPDEERRAFDVPSDFPWTSQNR